MIKTSKDAKHSFVNGVIRIEASFISISSPDSDETLKEYYNQKRYERRKQKSQRRTK